MRLPTLILSLAVLTTCGAAFAATGPSKLHMFIEHGTFYALNGADALDIDLVTGEISMSHGSDTVLKARLARQGTGEVDRNDYKRIRWIASVNMADGSVVGGVDTNVKDNVADLQRLGGNWLLTYEYQKWASAAQRREKSSACNGQLNGLIRTIVNAQTQCQGGGGAGCDQALDDLDAALTAYLQCLQDNPIEP